jgi:hypothetical protein
MGDDDADVVDAAAADAAADADNDDGNATPLVPPLARPICSAAATSPSERRDRAAPLPQQLWRRVFGGGSV